MAVNPRARIEIMHSKRGVQVITKTWSALGFEWLGASNPILPKLLTELRETGKAQITDASGTAYLTLIDPIDLPEA